MEFLNAVRKLAHSLGSHPTVRASVPTEEERLTAEATRAEKRQRIAQELAATMKAAEEARAADLQEHQERLERIQRLVSPPKAQPYRSADTQPKKKKSKRQ